MEVGCEPPRKFSNSKRSGSWWADFSRVRWDGASWKRCSRTTIMSGNENLRELGRKFLWEGAQEIVFREA